MTKFQIILFFLFFISCHKEQRLNTESNVEKIRNILKQERTAHFNRDVQLFMSGFKDSSWVANKGVVSAFIKNKDYKRFEEYFHSVDFIKWDDVVEPIINFSGDSSLAYAIVQKKVIVKNKFSKKIDTTDFAWVTIYRKINGNWLVEGNISTNKEKSD
jgi:hypothetical protein